MKVSPLHLEYLTMYENAALKQYQTVSLQARVMDATPYQLTQMLMEGGLARLAQARGAMEHGNVAQKGELIGKALGIIGGLRDSLDLDQGGEIAANLDGLYDYMTRKLLEANLTDNVQAVEEVSKLLREIKDGWDGIAEQAAMMPVSNHSAS